MPAQTTLTSTLSTSVTLEIKTRGGGATPCHLLTQQPQSWQSGDSQADAGTDDHHAVLVAHTVVDETPDYPAGPVTDVGENPNVGVERVRADQEQAVRLLPVDQKPLGDAHGEETKPDLKSCFIG